MLVDLTRKFSNYDGSPIMRDDENQWDMRHALLFTLNYEEKDEHGRKKKKQTPEETIRIFRLSEKIMFSTLVELTPEDIADVRKVAVDTLPKVLSGAICIALETSAEAEKKEEVKQDEPVAKSE